MNKLNNQSFNLISVLNESEKVDIKKKITVDSYHEELVESKSYKESTKLKEDYIDNVKIEDKSFDLDVKPEDMDTILKLYEYLDLDYNRSTEELKETILSDIKHDILTLNTSPINNEDYYWYMDENKSVLINLTTGEILDDTNSEDLEKLKDIFPNEFEESDNSKNLESNKELKESESNKITESKEKSYTDTKVSNLKEVKSQGNIFMLQDDAKFFVGEDYNKEQGLLENANIYENKEEADKDYLSRCEITKDGKEVKLD